MGNDGIQLSLISFMLLPKPLIFEMHVFRAFCPWNNIAQCLFEVDLEAFTGFNWKYKITFSQLDYSCGRHLSVS